MLTSGALHEVLICPDCRAPLDAGGGVLACPSCRSRFPVDHGIADFARGTYFDVFDPLAQTLTPEHLEGLQLEVAGSERRIRDFYAPLIRRVLPEARRVLDAGCGNGVSVDVLTACGFDAWGNDLSQLRKYQWRERRHREKLVVASALSLPFPDGWFDVVLSSGVLEHIGVAEARTPHYSVRALPDQREQRVSYVRELARVTRPGGRMFLDFPNGRFPVDFWHGEAPGSARFHSPGERFLPSLAEVRQLARAALGEAEVRSHSPRGRLQFKQAAGHLHGRILRAPAAALFRAMERRPFRWLAATPLNPFLVVEIERPGLSPAGRSGRGRGRA